MTTDIQLARRAAEAGSRIAMERFGGPLERTWKEGADFATDADTAVERAIVAVIREARPGDGIVGEEYGRTGPADAARVWLVDPLCGTLNYASGSPEWAVNVALVQGDEVVAAVVAEPASRTIYWSDRDAAGCERDGRAVPLRPDPASRLVEVNLDTADPDKSGLSSSRYLRSATFEALSPRVSGTSLGMTWVAAGRRAGFVIPGRRRESVHFSAPIGICRAAGCVMSGLRGEPLGLANEGMVVAADRATHDRLLAGIAPQLKGPGV